MLTIILYGPPGSGKSSTLTSSPSELTFDLEGVSKEDRDKWKPISPHIPTLLGAADQQVESLRSRFKESGVQAIHILILPERSLYDARRLERDLGNKSKAVQPDVYDQFEAGRDLFDYVTDVPLTTISEIRSFEQ